MYNPQKHPTSISTYHLRGENTVSTDVVVAPAPIRIQLYLLHTHRASSYYSQFPHFKPEVSSLRVLSRILGKDKDRKKVDEAYTEVEEKISALDKTKDDLEQAVAREEKVTKIEGEIKEEIEDTADFDEDMEAYVTGT